MTETEGPSADRAGFRELYRNEHYSRFHQEHRQGGTFGLRLMQVDQGEKVVRDPPLDELAFCSYARAPVGRARELARGHVHYGDEWREHELHPHFIDIHPSRRDCDFRLPPLHVHFVAVKEDRLARRLEEADIAVDVFEQFSNTFHVIPRAAALSTALWNHAGRDDPSISLRMDGTFLSMLAEMLQHINDRRLVDPVPAMGNPRFARVAEFVEANLERALGVGELAEVACLSVFHFGRAFKAETGMTPHRYVSWRRLQRAKAMLLATAFDITAVALECGYASHSHFSTAFRQATGTTPMRWRLENARQARIHV